MHRLTTTFVLGYHGCDEAVARRLVAGEGFVLSKNDYDWLGSGIYFWESNPRRGIEFARTLRKRQGARSPIKTPAVVGAIIDLRRCLDLSTSAGTYEVAEAFKKPMFSSVFATPRAFMGYSVFQLSTLTPNRPRTQRVGAEARTPAPDLTVR